MHEQTAESARRKPGNPTRSYLIATYLSFWAAVLLVGAAYLLSGQNRTVMNFASAVASWTPTAVLLLMFDRLVPGTSRRAWLREAFSARLKPGLLLAVTLVFFVSVGGTYRIMLWRNPALSPGDLRGLTWQSLLGTVFFAVIQGATGEEAGWRGYLQRHFEEKSGGKVLRSALLVGLAWSFWHTPLWLTTGLPAAQMLLYIVTFILGNLSLAVIIAVCYSACRNLFVPMWIHFLSNALSTVIEPYIGDIASTLEARCYLSAFYLAAALLFALWHVRRTGTQAPRAR